MPGEKPQAMVRALIAAWKRRAAGLTVAAFACSMLVLGACEPLGSASVEELLKRAEAHPLPASSTPPYRAQERAAER